MILLRLTNFVESTRGGQMIRLQRGKKQRIIQNIEYFIVLLILLALETCRIDNT